MEFSCKQTNVICTFSVSHQNTLVSLWSVKCVEYFSPLLQHSRSPLLIFKIIHNLHMVCLFAVFFYIAFGALIHLLVRCCHQLSICRILGSVCRDFSFAVWQYCHIMVRNSTGFKVWQLKVLLACKYHSIITKCRMKIIKNTATGKWEILK